MPGIFNNKKLVDFLLEARIISEEQLKAALAEQKKNRKRLEEVLIHKGFITEEQLFKALEEQLKIPGAALEALPLPDDFLDSLPLSMAERYNVLPLSKEGNELTLATADPFNVIAPVVQMVNSLIETAVSWDASDIHLEPWEKG